MINRNQIAIQIDTDEPSPELVNGVVDGVLEDHGFAMDPRQPTSPPFAWVAIGHTDTVKSILAMQDVIKRCPDALAHATRMEMLRLRVEVEETTDLTPLMNV